MSRLAIKHGTMSALGHKRTFARELRMSVLFLKADMRASKSTSIKCHKQTCSAS